MRMTLAQLRENIFATIEDMAALLGMAEDEYVQAEKGEIVPDAETLARIADVLNIRPKDIIIR